jgi:hypothetical protein
MSNVSQIEYSSSELDFRQRTLEKVLKAQSESLTKRLDKYLVREQEKIRAETAAFIFSERNQLQERIDITFDDFVKSIVFRLEEVESISNPNIRQVQIDRLESDIDSFIELQQNLMERFENIIAKVLEIDRPRQLDSSTAKYYISQEDLNSSQTEAVPSDGVSVIAKYAGSIEFSDDEFNAMLKALEESK